MGLTGSPGFPLCWLLWVAPVRGIKPQGMKLGATRWFEFSHRTVPLIWNFGSCNTQFNKLYVIFDETKSSLFDSAPSFKISLNPTDSQGHVRDTQSERVVSLITLCQTLSNIP